MFQSLLEVRLLSFYDIRHVPSEGVNRLDSSTFINTYLEYRYMCVYFTVTTGKSRCYQLSAINYNFQTFETLNLFVLIPQTKLLFVCCQSCN